MKLPNKYPYIAYSTTAKEHILVISGDTYYVVGYPFAESHDFHGLMPITNVWPSLDRHKTYTYNKQYYYYAKEYVLLLCKRIRRTY